MPGEWRQTATVVVADDRILSRRIVGALRFLDIPRPTTIAPDEFLADERRCERGDLVVACASPPVSLAALRLLRRRAGDGGLILVVADLSAGVLRKALDAGIDGFVAAESIDESLGATAAAVLAGQVVVPRQLLRQIARPNLSAREKQTLGMVIMGFTNAEIAGKLYLAESTIKTHLSSAFDKLGVRSRHEAAALILDPETGLGPGILGIPDAEPALGPHVVDREACT